MSDPSSSLSEVLFTLPPDARLIEVSDLSRRLQAKIGPVEPGQMVVCRPGFRVTTRLITPQLARLMGEFRAPRRLVDAVLRFSRAEGRDPLATLDEAFDALATLIDGRVLVPADAPEAQGLPPSLAPGEAFAAYEVERLVQALEDSEVYRARTARRAPAALKIARAGAPEALAHEARILTHLGGGDSPRLLESGEARGRPFLAMEWRPGTGVATAAQQARASGDRRRLHRMITNLLRAYGRLHAKAVVHGDIHPGNIFVAEGGQVTLLDFGRARLAGSHGVDAARAGIAHFHEPEMARALLAGAAPPAVTPGSEQYSLAVLCYFLLTGLHPVQPSAEHQELLARIVSRPPLPFAARGLAAWPAAERVLATALAKDPRDRFADVDCFARAFAAAVPSRRPRPPPSAASALLETSLESALQGWARDDAAHALPRAWLSLRAALARGDANLLAAADLWASRADDGWATAAVRAEIARARCDSAGEADATRAFVAAADTAQDSACLLAAARLLDGAAAREWDTTDLTAWAGTRLAALWTEDPQNPALIHAALALGQAGATHLPDGLRERLDALPSGAGDIWLWALAYDVFADPGHARRGLAFAAGSVDGLALIRLYQVFGDARWLWAARRRAFAAARRLAPGSPDQPKRLAAALLLVEIEAPERAVQPLRAVWAA